MALKSNSREVFSRLISISNEEMGDGKVKLIHSDLFRSACASVGIVIDEDCEVLALDILHRSIEKKSTDSYLLGIHLGLEIIANENIKNLINAIDENISQTPFFQIHLVNEDEHIQKCVNNFYEFCTTEYEKSDFMSGFELSVLFWKEFWKEARQ
jgi:hypothetical protein